MLDVGGSLLFVVCVCCYWFVGCRLSFGFCLSCDSGVFVDCCAWFCLVFVRRLFVVYCSSFVARCLSWVVCLFVSCVLVVVC